MVSRMKSNNLLNDLPFFKPKIDTKLHWHWDLDVVYRTLISDDISYQFDEGWEQNYDWINLLCSGFGFRQYSLFFWKYHYHPVRIIMKMFNARSESDMHF